MEKFYNKFRVTLSHIFFIAIIAISFLSLIFESIAYGDFQLGSLVYLALFAALYVAFIFYVKKGNKVLLVTFMAIIAALNLLVPILTLQGFGTLVDQFETNVGIGLAYILYCLISIASFAVLVLYFIRKLGNLTVLDNIIKLVLLIMLGVVALYFVLFFIGYIILMIELENGIVWYQMLAPLDLFACLGILLVNYNALENKAAEE